MADSLVIIPTYNERENIEKILRKVFSLEKDFDVLIVDDNSPDGTAQIVKNLMQEFPGRLFIEERKGKMGLGTAYTHGFKWAIRKGYDFVFEMDADFSHDPEDLLRLYNACAKQGADVAIGSRYVSGGKVKNWPIGRILMSYFASVYVRLVLWINIRDTTAGFKCYKRKVLESIDLDKIKFMGYAFQIEMKYTAIKLGFKVVEVPITFIDRKEGTSKMSSGIFKEAFLGVLQIKFSNIKARHLNSSRKAANAAKTNE
ncbi:MAG: polyprenol monophosphomannose synthase [Bacteroidetes bacterium]|nr:polyprenol monophosphomannose synthase [Bacteroidota bacterium]HET6245736.1 polyprenol monophosphomannose synthase [Bacteroidia bacterium]